VVCALAGLCLTALGTGLSVWWETALRRPGPLPAAKAILVPKGGTTVVARALIDQGAVGSIWQFRVAAWVTARAGPLHAAELAFPAHASLSQVLQILRTARPVQHHLTIPEGLTAQQIEALVGHAEAATGTPGNIVEGSVLPETYDYEYGADRDVLLARAKAAMDKELAVAWANRAPNLPLANISEALTLASIVERETAKPEERPHVAGVYLNRLRQGMKLEADPTVVYAVSSGAGVLDHPLTRAELRYDDAYNTYRHPGLPPGPICSPGRDAIEAVLHPMNSDDLFFVADGTGGHIFSRTYAAHDAAVAKWRAQGMHPAGD